MTQGTQAIDRAAALLSLVVRSEQPVSFTEVAASVDLPRSTVSRLLGALERNGLLERSIDGAYRGGPLFHTYASRFGHIESLVIASRPTLEAIGEATGETVNLAVPSGNRVLQVAQVSASFVLGATNWIDVDVPPHCSALGKVMYAFDAIPLPAGPLERRTPRTVTDLAAFRVVLDEVRRAGYAVARGELEDGLDAVAVPIHDPDGRVVAALGISGPAVRLTEHDRLGTLLVSHAAELSRTLRAQHA